MRADNEDDAVHVPKGVPQHEPFHLPVVAPAPVGPGQERPADLDLALRLIVAVKARGADDAPVLAVDGNERATRFQGLAEKDPEHRFLVAIIAGMLLPEERIRGHGIEVRIVFCSEWPKLEQVALQTRLEIKGHTYRTSSQLN